MKRIISLLLVFALLTPLVSTASAASATSPQSAADSLHTMGLFQGTGTAADGSPIYDLDRIPTRAEAVTMLVRLLGKESAAKNSIWRTPFQDLDPWSVSYIGYAYANGLTTGTSSTTFRGRDSVTAVQFLTLLLRALGYEEAAGDFQWERAWELSDRIGLTEGQYQNGGTFTRGDAALLSFRVLSLPRKGSSTTLVRSLLDEQVLTADAVRAAGLGSYAGLDSNQPKLADESTVKLVISYLTDALKSFSNSLDAADLSMQYWAAHNNRQGLYWAQMTQSYVEQAEESMALAWDLCGDYENLQDIRSTLVYAALDLEACVQYELTEANYNWFLTGTYLPACDSFATTMKDIIQMGQKAVAEAKARG